MPQIRIKSQVKMCGSPAGLYVFFFWHIEPYYMDTEGKEPSYVLCTCLNNFLKSVCLYGTT